MEHYVTLFDSNYLLQGLALHRSMERHISEYTLWILCLDEELHYILKRLELPNVRMILLEDVEIPELKAVKQERSAGEYCWTLTPFAPRFVFEDDLSISRVTYLDADMWFRKSPAPIFEELRRSQKGVLITDHAYAPEYDRSATSGQYCVQFMTFDREAGESVRKWWEERCVEWCYDRFEDNKFGDQKYLDDWPERFPAQVHVLREKEWLLAPWNATRFPYGNSICWHFHDLKIAGKNNELIVDFGKYPIPLPAVENVYQGYVKDLKASFEKLYLDTFINWKPPVNKSVTGFSLRRLLRRFSYQRQQRITNYRVQFQTGSF